MRTKRFAVWVCVCLLAAAGVWSQGTTSKVTGVVTDQSGAVIPGATVTLTNEATNISFTAKTTEAGTYVFESVQIGLYTVKVEAEGFKTFLSKGNRLTIQQPLTISAALEVGAVAATVEVTDSSELVQTSTSGNFGNLVETRPLTNLPLVGTRGRNPLNFINFQPGVAVGANTGGGVHVHGARDRAWNFTLDGVDINESSAGGSNFTPLRPNPDSVQEFSVLTGQFTAEYGRNSGGQVAMVTKSGGNEFHGSAFWFYRTPRFNANEWNLNRQGIGKGQFVQNIFGGSIGGPIWRDRTFFFGNAQILRTAEGVGVTRTVYTQAARSGLFRFMDTSVAGNLCPGQTIIRNASSCVDASGNPVAGITVGSYNIVANDPNAIGLSPETMAIIAATPLPNNFTTGDGFNTAGFSFVAPQSEQQEDWVLKIDHVINARNTIYGRWAMGRQDTVGDNVNGGLQSFPGLPNIVDTTRRPRNLALNWRTNPTSNITNEFLFGWSKFAFDFSNPAPNFAAQPHVILVNVTDPFNRQTGNLRGVDTYQWVNNLTYVRGAHTLKGGLNLRLQTHEDERGSVAGQNVNLTLNMSTTVNPVGAAFNLPTNINSTDLSRLRGTVNDTLGRVGTITQAFVSNADGSAYEPGGTTYLFKAQFNEYDFYFQDTWKLRRNLTLDLGLRWELKMSPSTSTGRILVPDTPIFAGTAPSNTVTWVPGKLYESDTNNLAPVIGLAWDPFSDGKTSVRANYRIAYDRSNTFFFSSSIFQSLPGRTLGVVDTSFGGSGGRLANLPALSPTTTPNAGLQPIPFSNGTQTVVDPRAEAPQTHMWGLSIQRDLGKGFLFEASYIGRHGVNLFGAYDVNVVDINAYAAVCGGETFLAAFNTVAAGGTSCLMDALWAPVSATGSAFVRSNFGTDLNRGSVAALANTTADRTLTGNVQMIAAAGFSPFFFSPYPQFNNRLVVFDSNDFSFYNALELQLSRRFRQGLGFQVSYTWAKSLDNRSFDPAFTTVGTGITQSGSSTPFNIFDRAGNKARSDFDRRHALQGYWVYELPFGRGKRWGSGTHGALERVIGGWELGGIIVWYAGRPFTVYGSGTFSNVINSPIDCTGCKPNDGRVFLNAGASDQVYFFNSAEIATFSNPAPGTLGNTGRNFFTTAGRFNLDLSIGKRTRINETHSIEFRWEMQNATNTPKWDSNPTADLFSSVLGRLLAPSNESRKMQMVLKYTF
jgi:hypothetical protein